MRLFLVCILLKFGVVGAIADDRDSAGEFLRMCQAQIPVEAGARIDFGKCIGQVSTFMALGPYLAEGLRFCPSSAIPIIGIGALARYLKENPEQKDEKSLSAMLLAYKKEWPCK